MPRAAIVSAELIIVGPVRSGHRDRGEAAADRDDHNLPVRSNLRDSGFSSGYPVTGSIASANRTWAETPHRRSMDFERNDQHAP